MNSKTGRIARFNIENEEATLINMESEAKLTLIKVIHTS
jgi:hypothetical protein